MRNIFLETPRLLLRRMGEEDVGELAAMLQDDRVMWAWGGGFDEEGVREWLEKTLALYASCGLGYFLAVEKESGRVVGQASLMPCRIDEREAHEIGYMLRHDSQGRGWAREAAAALAQHAFRVLHLPEVALEIRPENHSSLRVARALGAVEYSSFVKHYRGVVMPHLIFVLTEERLARAEARRQAGRTAGRTAGSDA